MVDSAMTMLLCASRVKTDPVLFYRCIVGSKTWSPDIEVNNLTPPLLLFSLSRCLEGNSVAGSHGRWNSCQDSDVPAPEQKERKWRAFFKIFLVWGCRLWLIQIIMAVIMAIESRQRTDPQNSRSGHSTCSLWSPRAWLWTLGAAESSLCVWVLHLLDMADVKFSFCATTRNVKWARRLLHTESSVNIYRHRHHHVFWLFCFTQEENCSPQRLSDFYDVMGFAKPDFQRYILDVLPPNDSG